MMRHVPALVLFVGLLAQSTLAEAAWKAGVAKANITPDKYLWMSGYGSRDKPADGKVTDLWAKAVVLEDERGQRGVILTLDLVGIDRVLSQRLCQSLADAHGLERRQIAICTSHTHTGPVVGMNLGPLHYLLVDDEQRQLIDEYTEVLHSNMVAVVNEALSDL